MSVLSSNLGGLCHGKRYVPTSYTPISSVDKRLGRLGTLVEEGTKGWSLGYAGLFKRLLALLLVITRQHMQFQNFD